MAIVDNHSQELLCLDCSGSCVEELNQGLEDFLSNDSIPSADSSSDEVESTAPIMTESNIEDSSTFMESPSHDPSPPSASSSQDTAGGVLSSILAQILGANSSTTETGRPVNIIIRQATLNGSENEGGLSQGILGLIGSLTNIRGRSSASSGAGTFGNAMSNEAFEAFLHHVLMNESSHAGLPPASEALITNLPRIQITADNYSEHVGECSISQEQFEIGDEIVALPCGHRYKEEAIIQWLKMHNSCPVCRIPIEDNSNCNNSRSNTHAASSGSSSSNVEETTNMNYVSDIGEVDSD
jgi:hypothetical protein